MNNHHSFHLTNDKPNEWADQLLDGFLGEYQQTNSPIRVSFRELCSPWAWAKRSDVYTHYLHRYPAKLLPYIPIFFLSTSLASEDDIVLDPFAGTGTVGLESIIHPQHARNCLLIEINPLGRLIAAAKSTPIDPRRLYEKSVILFKKISEHSGKSRIPRFPGVDFWFRQKAQRDLVIIRDCIEVLDADMKERDFFWASYSSIIRDMSRADPSVAPPVKLSVKKFPRLSRAEADKKISQKRRFKAKTLFRKTVARNIERMEQLWETQRHSLVQKQSLVIGMDARKMAQAPYLGKGHLDLSNSKRLPNNSIGLVISSPPYINAQKYARTTKLELWWLGLIDETTEGLADFDGQLIGTERIPAERYAKFTPIGNPDADALLEEIYELAPRAAGIVSAYWIDMKLAIKEIARVLRPEGHCVLAIGNNVILNHVFPNNQILADIAHENGLELKTVLVDEIRSRGLITKRHKTAGMILDEWILVLKKPRGA